MNGKIRYLAIAFMLICIVAWGCELGTTYKDYYGSPDSYDIANGRNGEAYYYPNGNVLTATGTIWKLVKFDKNGVIAINTGFNGSEQKWLPKGKEPYVLYKGHRWYPQYHGIIYVYKDGREVK